MDTQHLRSQTWVLLRWAVWFTSKDGWWHIGLNCSCWGSITEVASAELVSRKEKNKGTAGAAEVDRTLPETVQSVEWVGDMGWCLPYSQWLRLGVGGQILVCDLCQLQGVWSDYDFMRKDAGVLHPIHRLNPISVKRLKASQITILFSLYIVPEL